MWAFLLDAVNNGWLHGRLDNFLPPKPVKIIQNKMKRFQTYYYLLKKCSSDMLSVSYSDLLLSEINISQLWSAPEEESREVLV